MKWRELARELAALTDEGAEGAAIQEERHPGFVRDLLQAEPAQRALLDAVCRVYAQNGTLPVNLSEIQAGLFYIRLAHAALFCELLGRTGCEVFSNHRIDAPKARVLEFLLVDVWGEWGWKRWVAS